MGEPDEDGIYPKYRVPNQLRPAHKDPQEGVRVTWGLILDHWDLVLRDLVDIGVLDPLRDNPGGGWLWLRRMIQSAVDRPGSWFYSQINPSK